MCTLFAMPYHFQSSQSQSQSQLYCQFCHMYRTYIQRIEIALLSYCLVHTDNTKHKQQNAKIQISTNQYIYIYIYIYIQYIHIYAHKQTNKQCRINGVVQRAYQDYLKWQGAVFFIQTVRRGSWMNEVSPMLYKWPVLVSVWVWVCVCVCVSVCECGWWWWGGGPSSVIRGVREGRGGKDGREFSFLTAWWMKLSFSLFVLAWRLLSLLPDGSRLKKLCVGWVGSPAMLRALRVRRVL